MTQFFLSLAVLCAIFALFLAWFGTLWLLCRLTARRCPRCGSGWRTELVGAWAKDEEDWSCQACSHQWSNH